jgi:hypothetical protein
VELSDEDPARLMQMRDVKDVLTLDFVLSIIILYSDRS